MGEPITPLKVAKMACRPQRAAPLLTALRPGLVALDCKLLRECLPSQTDRYPAEIVKLATERKMLIRPYLSDAFRWRLWQSSGTPVMWAWLSFRLSSMASAALPPASPPECDR